MACTYRYGVPRALTPDNRPPRWWRQGAAVSDARVGSRDARFFAETQQSKSTLRAAKAAARRLLHKTKTKTARVTIFQHCAGRRQAASVYACDKVRGRVTCRVLERKAG